MLRGCCGAGDAAAVLLAGMLHHNGDLPLALWSKEFCCERCRCGYSTAGSASTTCGKDTLVWWSLRTVPHMQQQFAEATPAWLQLMCCGKSIAAANLALPLKQQTASTGICHLQ